MSESGNKRVYEFNFDGMTIGDYVIVMNCGLDPRNVAKTNALLSILPKFTNVDIMALPLTELNNMIKQMIAQLSDYFLEFKSE